MVFDSDFTWEEAAKDTSLCFQNNYNLHVTGK